MIPVSTIEMVMLGALPSVVAVFATLASVGLAWSRSCQSAGPQEETAAMMTASESPPPHAFPWTIPLRRDCHRLRRRLRANPVTTQFFGTWTTEGLERGQRSTSAMA